MAAGRRRGAGPGGGGIDGLDASARVAVSSTQGMLLWRQQQAADGLRLLVDLVRSPLEMPGDPGIALAGSLGRQAAVPGRFFFQSAQGGPEGRSPGTGWPQTLAEQRSRPSE